MSDCLWEEVAEPADPNAPGKRAYVGVKNNYTEEDVAKVQVWAANKCKYLVYGREVGKQGTPHLQMYMEFKDKISMTAIVKKLFPMWLGYRKGTPKQAAGYCKKADEKPPKNEGYDWFFDNPSQDWDGEEFGEISQQGKRTDIDVCVEMIVHEGATVRQVAMEHPAQFVKYNKGFRDLRSLVLQPRNLQAMPEVIVLWGPTGVGKTRDAYIKYWPDEPHYVWKPSNGNWWDGYDGEKKIIIDEFRGQMTWSDILGLLDRNEYRAPYKGGFVNIQADKFVITSPFPPDRWYKDDDRYDRFKQLERRITKVIEYRGPLSSFVS